MFMATWWIQDGREFYVRSCKGATEAEARAKAMAHIASAGFPAEDLEINEVLYTAVHGDRWTRTEHGKVGVFPTYRAAQDAANAWLDSQANPQGVFAWVK